MADTAMTQALKVLAKTGKIYLADRGTITENTAWMEYFMTTENTLNIDQAEGTTQDIRTDQKTAPVSTIRTAGEFTISFDVPSVDSVVLALFFNTSTPSYTPSGYTSIGVGTEMKTLNKMMKINFTNNDSDAIFTNVDLVGVVTKSSDGAFSIRVTGTVLAAGGAGMEDKEMIFVHKD